MAKRSKRIKRFRAGYGVGIKKRVAKIESEQFAAHNCPQCSAPRVKRIAIGIFECKKCNLKFAGGAYTPETMSGSIVKKMVSQKTFLPNLNELIASKEEIPAEETPKKIHVAEEDSNQVHAISKSQKKKRRGK